MRKTDRRFDRVFAGEWMGRRKAEKGQARQRCFGQIRSACEEGDIGAVDVAMNEIEKYGYDSDEGLTAWLRENVDGMNYVAIAEKLKERK